MAQWVGDQGQVKVAKKSLNTPTCSGPPANRKPNTENEKRFFFHFEPKTCWIRGWFG